MKKRVNRLIACSLLVLSSIAVEANDRVYKLKLAATWGKMGTPLIDAPRNMANIAKKMSNGRLDIQVHSSNKHKAPFGILDMVKAGQYDMGHSASYFFKGKDIATMPFTTMPFGLTAPEYYSWFYYGGGEELMKKVYDKHNVLAFPGGNTGVQMGGWFKEEINSVEDLKGLKMRVPGFAGEILSKLGVQVTNLPPGELYTALERNTIDAVEWVGPSMDIKMGFHKVAPYYYTGWHEPGAETQFYINQRVFKKLPEDLKAILTTAIRVTSYDLYIKNYHLSAMALEDMFSEYPNIKVKTFPKEVIDEMKKVNHQLRKEMSSKNSLLKKILESQQSYQNKVREWTRMSDYLYLKDNL